MLIDRGTRAEIYLDAIVENMRFARSTMKPETKLCAVVKANAYGHGAVEVAKACVAGGADYLAVAFLEEGVELREAGIAAPILVLGSLPNKPRCAELCVEFDIEHACYDEERLLLLNEAGVKAGKKAKIHIALDTGMSRIGCQLEDAVAFAKLASTLPGIEICGMFSHMCKADESDKWFARLQFERYMTTLAAIEAEGIKIPIRHIANSASITELPEYQLDMVRQGISLYGLRPDDDCPAYFEGLHPAMVVKSEVAHVKKLPVGRLVGYGGTYVTGRERVIATIPVGYADGVPRLLSNKGYMLVHGQKAPIVGRVCMDQLMLDVTDIPDVKVGDEVVVFGGKDLPIEQVAAWAQTISHEVVCDINKRIPRVFIKN